MIYVYTINIKQNVNHCSENCLNYRELTRLIVQITFDATEKVYMPLYNTYNYISEMVKIMKYYLNAVLQNSISD